MQKILFLTNYFYPEIFRGNDIAFYLAEKGYDVTVLTNIPNYPDGHYFKGYGLFRKRREIINGVKVVRVPVVPRGNGSKILMALNYISGLFFMYIYAFHFAIWHKYDSIFVQQLSPLFIGLPATLVKKIQKIPLFFWILDLWPESLSSIGINNKQIYSVINSITKHVYKNCTKILISSLGFKDILVGRNVPEEKIIYFPNWSEDTISTGEIKTLPELPKGFLITFAGNLGEAQNLDNIMEVMKQTSSLDEIKWIIVGTGKKHYSLKQFVKDNKLSNSVYLMGRYDISYMMSFFNKSDIMLVSLSNKAVLNATLPAKVQAYMSVGKPILGMINGEGQYIINKAECGFCVDADDIEGMVKIVKSLTSIPLETLVKLGNNGKAYYKKHFDKTVCMNNLLQILNNTNNL